MKKLVVSIALAFLCVTSALAETPSNESVARLIGTSEFREIIITGGEQAFARARQKFPDGYMEEAPIFAEINSGTAAATGMTGSMVSQETMCCWAVPVGIIFPGMGAMM